MVGRDREMARVRGLLGGGLGGRGRLVLCTGEAGIGKTRLAEELAANGAGSGVYMGSVELQTGLAAAALGHLDAAAADLQLAASVCDANGARGYAVQARVELAAALARRQATGGLSQAKAALDAAAGGAGGLVLGPRTSGGARAG